MPPERLITPGISILYIPFRGLGTISRALSERWCDRSTEECKFAMLDGVLGQGKA